MLLLLCHSRMDRKKHSMSYRGLTTVSIKTIKNTNNFSIFNWIPRSSRGMTEVKLIHAGMT
ncbi:hypothetical protein [Rickettsia sp.]|uniref:hypothetical protein n=1 Tax=Rickettsia sp. TaxID=789 RepID=UPI00397A65EE